MDLILIITKYQNGRELLRKANVYYVVRDMHLGMGSFWFVIFRIG